VANDITRSPFILDTAGAIFAATVKLRPRSIRWVSTNSQAGNEVILKDASGRVVFHSCAAGSGHLDVYMPEEIWKGLTVDTIDSGFVYLEL
jgi:formylmethanofuran dehydrogenase subunit D